jgi:hypothetical protein
MYLFYIGGIKLKYYPKKIRKKILPYVKNLETKASFAIELTHKWDMEEWAKVWALEMVIEVDNGDDGITKIDLSEGKC